MELKEVTYEVMATGDKMPSGYYLKADVDAIIAQKDFEIDRLKEFNAFLKNRISNGDVGSLILLDDLEQKDKRRWRKVDKNFPTADDGYFFVLWEDGLPDVGYIGAEDAVIETVRDRGEGHSVEWWMPLPSDSKEEQDEV